MCLQRHNPINLIKMEAYKKIEEAKQILKQNGYYVDNLWSIEDVKGNHNMDDDDAYEVLDRAMNSEYIVSNIFEIIEEEVVQIKNED